MDIFGPLLFIGLFVFLPFWLMVKVGDFIERYHSTLWARMGDQPDERQRLRQGERHSRADDSWGGGGFGGGDGGGG